MTPLFLTFLIAFVALFVLSGCNVAERLANGAIAEPNGEVIEPSGEVITPSGEVITPSSESEVIALENDMCLVKARHFKGLVRVPCDQVARETAP
jgi:hypothetical protein